MRVLFYIVMFFGISILPCSLQASAEQNVEKEQANSEDPPPPIADPSNLKANWWKAYELPEKLLSKQVDETKTLLEQLQSNLDSDKHQNIIENINTILFNLDLYMHRVRQEDETEQISPKFLDSYSIDELLSVNKNYLSLQNQLQHFEKKVDSESIKLSRLKRKVDELSIAHKTAPESTFEKLNTGTMLMAKRIEQAALEADIRNVKQTIQKLQKNKEELSKELDYSQNNIMIDQDKVGYFEKQLAEEVAMHEKSLNTLKQLRRKAFYEEQKNIENELVCCLWDFKLLTQSGKTVVDRMKVAIAELSILLSTILTNESSFSTEELKNSLNSYQEELTEVQTEITQWEQTIKEDQAKISRQINYTLKADDDLEQGVPEEITDIHLEIAQALSIIDELKIYHQQVQLLIDQLRKYIVQNKSYQETWWLIVQDNFESFISSTHSFFKTPAFRLHNQPVMVLDLILAILIVIAAVIFSKLNKRFIYNDKYVSRRLNSSTKYILDRTLRYFIIIMGVVFALSYIGYDFTNLMIFAGALGVGVGFGLQNIVNNTLSGFLILFQRNVKVGDIVELDSNLIGKVMEVNLQNTRIRSFEGVDLILPNGKLTSQMMNNWTFNDACRRFRVPFHVGLGVNKEQVRRIVLGVAESIPAVKKGDPRYDNPQLWLMSFSEFGIDFQLVVWVDLTIPLPNGIATATLLWEIESALKEEGISITYPQRTLHTDTKPCYQQ